MVYLLHFSLPVAHARHYLGTTNNIVRRLAEHELGWASPLTRAARDAGATFTIARTWPGGRGVERALKMQHNGARLCPICYPKNRRALCVLSS